MADAADKLSPLVPRAAVAAYICNNNGERVLLIKRGHAPAAGEWALPGGKVRAGETLEAALKREIHEETGLCVTVQPTPLYVFDSIHRDSDGTLQFHYVIIDFAAKVVAGQIHAGDDAKEIAWISKDELDNLNVNTSTLHFLREIVNFGEHDGNC